MLRIWNTEWWLLWSTSAGCRPDSGCCACLSYQRSFMQQIRSDMIHDESFSVGGGDAQELTNTWKAFESTFLPSVVSPCVHAKTQPEAGGTVKACHWAVWSQVCAFGSAPSVQSWNQLRVECGGEWGRCHLPSISQQRSSLSGAEMEAWMAAISRLETPFCKTLCVLCVWTQRGHRKLQWEPFEHFLPKPADS